MLQNAILLKLADGWPHSATDLEEAIADVPFVPCSATQQQSIGWVPPRGHEHGALVETVNGQWLARFAIEVRKVPADAVRKKTKEMADAITKQTGREPGKKEMRDLRDDALVSLLPQAFPKRTDVHVWIDPERRFMWVDATSQGKVDELVSSLVRLAKPGFGIRLLQTARSPQEAMTSWLAAPDTEDVLPEAFTIGSECELRGGGDQPATVRFSKHALNVEQVRQNIAEGKLPTKMSLVYQGRIEFVLNHALALRKIRFLDGVLDQAPPQEVADRFDADAALATGELAPLMDDLVEALEGELSDEAA